MSIETAAYYLSVAFLLAGKISMSLPLDLIPEISAKIIAQS